MEKYYCDHCRLLFDEQDHCSACSRPISNKIWIEVQNQSSNHSSTSD